MQIFVAIRGLVMFIIHLLMRYETSFFYFILNIIYIPLTIIAVLVAIIDTKYYILIPAFFIIELAVLFKVKRMMNSKVKGTVTASATGSAPTAETKPQPASTSDLVKPGASLKFIPYDAASTLTRFVGQSELTVQSAQADFKQRMVRDTVLAFGFFGLAILWALAGGNLAKNAEDAASATALIGAAILASVLLRALFLGRQYRPKDAHFGRYMWQHPFKIYGEGCANVLQRGGIALVITGIAVYWMIRSFSKQDDISVLVLLGITGIYFYLLMRPKPRPGFNIKLLLLRTFYINKNSLFTFGRLLSFWEHVGNYFTVMDTSYVQHKYRFLSRRTLAVMTGLALLTFFLGEAMRRIFNLQFPVRSDAIFGIQSYWPAAILATIIVIAFEYYMIEREFIKTLDGIDARLNSVEIQPRGLMDFTFRGVPTLSNNDTWRQTVVRMMGKADVVLMDLRGFTEGNKGCQEEIDFLLDRKHVSRILFLIDQKDNKEVICNIISQRWEELHGDSPNLKVEKPEINIYVCSEQDEADVQGIFNLLLTAAYSDSVADISPGVQSEGLLAS